MTQIELPPPQQVDVGDFHLSYTDVGVGHPLVWLHGSGPGASGLSNFRRNLPAFSDFRNLVFDHPRYGDSGRPHIDGPLIPHSGEHMLRALDALGIEKFSLVGNSYGGGVAAWLAAIVPERVHRVVLMAPGGYMPADQTRETLPRGLQLIFKAMRDGVDRPLMEDFVNTMLVNKELATGEMIDERLKPAIKNNPEWEGKPNIGDVSDLVPKITAPVQLLWGKEDQFVPTDWAMFWLNNIDNAELHILPHCGHWFQYELQDQFNQLAGEFLRK